MKYDFYLNHGGMIDGIAIAAGGKIANIETPDGIDPIKAARAIVNGLATTDAPAPVVAPVAQPEITGAQRTKFSDAAK